jgi:cytoskeletal protein CcmA (bactofilin family)/DNA-directed RNA polymerase subunit RPC12/RpoP
MKPQKVLVVCPHCGHGQPEPPGAYSTHCKKCGQHFRLKEVWRPPGKARPALKPTRRITCFDCGTELEVPPTGQSTMCKRCSSYVDLQDHRITGVVSKNFRTKGRLVIEETGHLLNTDSIAGDVVIKGRFLGKLTVEGSLEIHTGAQVKGRIEAARLIIPEGNRFAWPQTLVVAAAEIAGELVANLQAKDTVLLRPTARFFGDITARDLVVESGAVWEGRARVGVAGSAD